MARTFILYALALALAATGLEWLKFRYWTRPFPTEIYLFLIAVGLIIALISAALLRNPRLLPANAAPAGRPGAG